MFLCATKKNCECKTELNGSNLFLYIGYNNTCKYAYIRACLFDGSQLMFRAYILVSMPLELSWYHLMPLIPRKIAAKFFKIGFSYFEACYLCGRMLHFLTIAADCKHTAHLNQLTQAIKQRMTLTTVPSNSETVPWAREERLGVKMS